MEFKDILTKVAQALELSLTDMAEALGVHRSKLYNLRGGNWNPGYDFCRAFLEKFPQVNAEFLMTGKGDILKTGSPQLGISFDDSSGKDVIIEALTEQVQKYKKRVQELETK